MESKEVILSLAKLVIAAAWADGELSNDEINALKDLLFNADEVTAEDWTVLKMYMDAPVGKDEQEELLGRVTDAIRGSADKDLALNTLEHLFGCDGKVTPEEHELMTRIRQDIDGTGTGLISGLSKAIKSAIGQRSTAVRASCLRERDSDDYVQNTIFYDLQLKLKNTEARIDRPEGEIRKLCLATGLLAHVAHVDETISSEERAAIRGVLAEDWHMTDEEAELLVAVACDRTTRGLDYFRLSHGYFECTNAEERKGLLRTLFRIANAAGKTTNDEIEEVRRVANSLKLSHEDFIAAKLTVPREDRNGL